MNKEELKIILDNHKIWLLDKTKGEKANLVGAYLIEANLYKAKLAGAYFRGAILLKTTISTLIINSVFTINAYSKEAITIGCKTYSLKIWKERGLNIAEREGLSEQQIGKLQEDLKLIEYYFNKKRGLYE